MFFHSNGLGLTSSLQRFFIFYRDNLRIEIADGDFTFSIKRISILAILLFLSPLLICWNHLGFFLDDVLYPDWKLQRIDDPLFLVGNARSGTTWLHRLIALDEETFTSFRTWEIIFGASVTWRKAIINLYIFDELFIFGLHYKLLCFIEKLLVNSALVHQVGLQEVEEDEWLMMHIFLSQLVLLLFPLGGAILYPAVLFDKANLDDLPLETRNQIFVFYRQCVQRHLYVRAGGSSHSRSKIFLSKNPPFTMRLAQLYKYFPTCRVACLLRDPVQSIPSMISYIGQVWNLSATPAPVKRTQDRHGDRSSSSSRVKSDRGHPCQRYPKTSDLLNFCIAHYTYPLEYFKESGLGAERWAFVPYRDLLQDVESTVVNLLTQFRYMDADSHSRAVHGNGDSNGGAANSPCPHDVNAAVTAPQSNICETGANDVLVGSSVSQCFGHSNTSRSRGRSRSISTTLGDLLRKEKQRKGQYVSAHYHSVEECCNMSEEQLRILLEPVYRAHPDAF